MPSSGLLISCATPAVRRPSELRRSAVASRRSISRFSSSWRSAASASRRRNARSARRWKTMAATRMSTSVAIMPAITSPDSCESCRVAAVSAASGISVTTSHGRSPVGRGEEDAAVCLDARRAREDGLGLRMVATRVDADGAADLARRGRATRRNRRSGSTSTLREPSTGTNVRTRSRIGDAYIVTTTQPRSPGSGGLATWWMTLRSLSGHLDALAVEEEVRDRDAAGLELRRELARREVGQVAREQRLRDRGDPSAHAFAAEDLAAVFAEDADAVDLRERGELREDLAGEDPARAGLGAASQQRADGRKPRDVAGVAASLRSLRPQLGREVGQRLRRGVDDLLRARAPDRAEPRDAVRDLEPREHGEEQDGEPGSEPPHRRLSSPSTCGSVSTNARISSRTRRNGTSASSSVRAIIASVGGSSKPWWMRLLPIGEHGQRWSAQAHTVIT